MGSLQADAQSTLMLRHIEMAHVGFHDRDDDILTSVSKAQAWAVAMTFLDHTLTQSVDRLSLFCIRLRCIISLTVLVRYRSPARI